MDIDFRFWQQENKFGFLFSFQNRIGCKNSFSGCTINGQEVADGEFVNPSECNIIRCDMGIETDLTEEIYGKI